MEGNALKREEKVSYIKYTCMYIQCILHNLM